MTTTITNIHRNRMGTISFDGKFQGMRKAQDFIVYPMHEGNEAKTARVQSDTRIGLIDLASGLVRMSPSIKSGAYNVHLSTAAMLAEKVNAEDLFILKAQIFDSASAKAGTNGIVHTDNSAALNVFSE